MSLRRGNWFVSAAAALGITLGILAWPSLALAADPQVDDNGAIHMPAYVLPESSLLSADAHAVLRHERARVKEYNSHKTCPDEEGADAAHMPAIRKCQAESFYKTPEYQHLRELYPVQMTPTEIGGIYTELFVPAEGVAPKNSTRVLINLHGGGFIGGARYISHLESVPIASIGKIKVISIDYRQAPEFRFPAASEDVAAVYRQLLKTYKPRNIGIYGCSAGGMLTAEVVAWFQRQKLPMPGGDRPT